MFLWAVLIRVSLVFFSINIVTPWASTSEKHVSWSNEDITQYIGWLTSLHVINTSGNCMARSLLYYRFLSIAGKSPKIIIGISNNFGHAWVELEDKVVSEYSSDIEEFTPILVCYPGESKFTAAPILTTGKEAFTLDLNV